MAPFKHDYLLANKIFFGVQLFDANGFSRIQIFCLRNTAIEDIRWSECESTPTLQGSHATISISRH